MSQGLRIHRKRKLKNAIWFLYDANVIYIFYTKQSGLPEVELEDRWVIRAYNCRCSMQ